MNASPLRRRVSRILHWIDNQSSQTGVAVVASLLVVTSVVALAVDGFPTRWENAFSVVGTAIALIMLFVIQHTQSRHQSLCDARATGWSVECYGHRLLSLICLEG